jgi:mRNA-degrading endonuclease RelE of RelBE toxin-antitoxin system
MEFIETSIFTRQITELLDDSEYEQLQNDLVINPKAGSVISQTGGIRKIRYSVKGRGKRGSIRVIYYYVSDDQVFYMLLAYPKNKKDDLTIQEKKALKAYIERCL